MLFMILLLITATCLVTHLKFDAVYIDRVVDSDILDVMNDGDIEQRVILAYGALARSLKNVNSAMADSIAHQLEMAANSKVVICL